MLGAGFHGGNVTDTLPRPGIEPVPPCVALYGNGQGNGLACGGIGIDTLPIPPD